MAKWLMRFLAILGAIAFAHVAEAQVTLPHTGVFNSAQPVVCINPTSQLYESCAGSGGGGGAGAVYGPTAVGSAAANPPVIVGGTANAAATGTVQVDKVDSGGNTFVNLSEVGGAAIALGSTTSSASIPVVVASDQGAITVKGGGTAGTPGTAVLAIQGVASGTAVPISAASLPLPTGAMGSTGGTVGLVAGTANVGNINPATHGGCTVLCSNSVLKSSAGVLYSFEVWADSTLSGAAWYVMIFDATSLPADGTVTPAKCYAQPSGTTQMGGTLDAGGVTFGTGIVIGVSTTGCFSKTASTHALVAGDYQ